MAGTPPPVRRAGTGRGAGGDVVRWVVAEGRRGRRWRETVTRDGGLRHSLLIETAPDGRFSHLELATPAGMLTLHPEPDGTLHGNVVTDDGVRHVTGMSWAADGLVLLDGSAVAAAATLRSPAGRPEPGTQIVRTVLRIGADLGLATGPASVARTGDGRWRVDGDEVVRLDDDGLPRLDAGTTWPLELAE